jgi:hypothetical protein
MSYDNIVIVMSNSRENEDDRSAHDKDVHRLLPVVSDAGNTSTLSESSEIRHASSLNPACLQPGYPFGDRRLVWC